MAHFAKIENNVVVQVNVIDEQFFADNPERYTGTWKQTSYNTQGGVHLLGGVPLRKNYAAIGMIYDSERDAFYWPQPYSSWLLNEETCIWEAPVAYPNDGQDYEWNETTKEWIEIQ